MAMAKPPFWDTEDAPTIARFGMIYDEQMRRRAYHVQTDHLYARPDERVG